MKKIKILIFLFIFSFQVVSVSAEGDTPLSPFPVKVEVLPISFPEYPDMNIDILLGSKRARFYAGEELDLLYASENGCFVSGFSDIQNQIVKTTVSCHRLALTETNNSLTYGGLTVDDYIGQFLQPKNATYSFSSFLRSNYLSETDDYEIINRGGEVLLGRYFSSVMSNTSGVTSLTFLNTPIKEPGESFTTTDIMYPKEYFTTDEHAFIVKNETDTLFTYDLASGNKTTPSTLVDRELQHYSQNNFNLIDIPPHTNLLIFHIRYDATTKPEHSQWAGEVDYNSFPIVLNNVSFFFPETMIFAPGSDWDVTKTSRTSPEFVCYYDPETKQYDLFFLEYNTDLMFPVWLMYSSVSPYPDGGDDLALQVWEYEISDFIELPPYSFVDMYKDSYPPAYNWIWVVERVGFNEYFQQQVEKILP